MKNMHCIIKKACTNKILLVKNSKGCFELPYTLAADEKDLLNYIKNELGINNIQSDYLKFKYEDDNNIYYICDEPYFDKEIKKEKRENKNWKWVDIAELKEFLQNRKNNKSNKLINDLNVVLGSNFSFSMKERIELDKKIDEAITKEEFKLARFYNEIGLVKLKGTHTNEKEKLILEKYKLLLIKDLNDSLRKIHTNKLDEIKKKNLEDLTHFEAKIIGKENEWNDLFYDTWYSFGVELPFIPEDDEFDYFSMEALLQNKSDITPAIIKDLYRRYHGKSFTQIKNNILKRQYKKAHK